MESFSDPCQDLADAERAAAAPYLDYPPTPTWYPASVGIWSGALVAVFSLDGGLPRSLALLGLVLVEMLFIGWYRRKRGVMPRLRNAPPEIAHEMRWYFVGLLVLLLAVVGIFQVSTVAAALLTLVLVTAGVTVYERRYARAAAAARTRLA